MATPRLLSYGLFVSSFVTMLFFYATDMSLRLEAQRMHQRQEERRQQINNTCLSDKQRFLEELIPDKLEHFLVDDGHSVIYCYVPKVACTNLKKIMFMLKTGPPYGDPSALNSTVHNSEKLTFLKDYPVHEIKAKLKHYTKFLFVREPFVRLLSAYRNKIEVPQKYFYERYGRKILDRYDNRSDLPKTYDIARKSRMRVSFHNFIQYLLDPSTAAAGDDEHWRQIERLCHPCHIQYNFVGQQETMDEDSDYLMEVLKLKGELKLPSSPIIRTSKDSLAEWYKELPLNTRRKLYKHYELDYKLFGYSYPDGLLKD